jgi:hypothetical protein
VVSAVLVAMQRCAKHVSAAMNQHATIEETMFFVGGRPEAIKRGSEAARIRTELSSGVPSDQ